MMPLICMFGLARAADDAADEVVVVAQEPATADPLMLDPLTVRYTPGALGDPVRALQGQPGVARSPFGLGLLLVRGTDPQHQRVWLDDVPLPRALHFGGLGAVVEPRLLRDVELSTGAPPASRAGNLGGVVVLHPQPGLGATWSEVSLDVLQVGAAFQVRVGPDTALAFGARRSWLDVLGPLVLGSAERTWRIPWYQDAHLRIVHRTPRAGEVQAWLIGFQDRMASTGAANAPRLYEASTVRGVLTTKSPGQVWKLRTAWSLGPDTRGSEVPPGGTDLQLAALPLPSPGTDANDNDFTATGRMVVTGAVPRGPVLELGLDGGFADQHFRYVDAADDESFFGGAIRQWGATWAQVDVAPVRPIRLTGSVRASATAVGAVERSVGGSAGPAWARGRVAHHGDRVMGYRPPSAVEPSGGAQWGWQPRLATESRGARGGRTGAPVGRVDVDDHGLSHPASRPRGRTGRHLSVRHHSAARSPGPRSLAQRWRGPVSGRGDHPPI